MKRGTPDHWKMSDLARRLKIPARYALPWANGVLERLWHYTAKYHPQGDVGSSPNWAIAEACAWPAKDANSLVDALIASRWLDPDENHRLIVHDWHKHADELTKKTLKNRGLSFFIPEKFRLEGEKIPPALSLSLKPEPEPEPEPEPTHTHIPDTPGAIAPESIPPSAGVGEPSLDDLRVLTEFDRVWPKFWIRTGRGAAKKAWRGARKKATLERIEAAIAAQGPGILALAQQRGSTPIHPSTWLNQERWDDDVGALSTALLRSDAPSRHSGKSEETMRKFDELMWDEVERRRYGR